MDLHSSDTESFVNVSDFLGAKKDRFLSEGFKRVYRKICSITREDAHTLSAVADVVYPADWSRKGDSERDDMHLSTLDVAILSGKLCELFLIEQFQLTASEVERAWIRKISMRLGNSSYTALQQIPITCSIQAQSACSVSLGGTLTTFHVKIGNATSELVVDHGRSEKTTEDISLWSLPYGLLSSPLNCFGSDYMNKDIDLSDLTYDASASSVSGRAVMNFDRKYTPGFSIGRAYSTACNLFDLMIIGGQLAQFLIYHHDMVIRKDSNNLWTRKFEAEIPAPLYSLGGCLVTVSIESAKQIQRKDGIWSIIEPRAHFGNGDGSIYGNFVHLLPSLTESAA